jgi:SAM-dependent methyltransferase
VDLRSEFAKREPWITRFVIDGVDYGGQFVALADHRVDQFFECFPKVRTILDLGSLEGGQTFALARHPGVEHVVGLEARASNIEKTRFVQELLHISNARFVEADLEKTDLVSFGKFDAVFCSGLLYHLPEPWKLIDQIPQVASNLFIWTHYADDLQADRSMDGFNGKEYVEAGLDEPNAGMSPKSFWLTLGSLIKALTISGFQTIRIVENDLKHANGPALTLAATTASISR